QQNAGTAPGRRRHRVNRAIATCFDEPVAREMRGQVPGDANRAHSRAAATMGNAEGLVQVEVTNVGAYGRGVREANLGVHVCAVEIDLPPMLMYDSADFLNLLFEHTVGRRIGN